MMLHSKADVQQNNDAPVRCSAGTEGQLLGRKPLSVYLNHRLKKKQKNMHNLQRGNNNFLAPD